MRTRFYNPDLKRFMNADILDGSIEDSTTLNLYTFVNGNPISFIDPFGMSAERGNNANVISGIHGVFEKAYQFYSKESDSKRIELANNAVMKYIIYDQYYKNAGWKKEFAWKTIVGDIDNKFMEHMKQFPEYEYLKTAKMYDPSTGAEIDFVHMIATLNANYSDNWVLGFMNYSLNTYAGWAGDLITLASDVQEVVNDDPDVDIVKKVQELLSGDEIKSSFSQSDLLGDIDAVLIFNSMDSQAICQAIEAYYKSDYKNRYSLFFDYEFSGSFNAARVTASNMISPSIFTVAFKSNFQSSYSSKIIPDVAQGFAEYISSQAGR